MISITVKDTQILGVTDYPITSGSVGLKVIFEFTDIWEELDRIAVFKCGDIGRCVYLEDKNECELPWEILTVENIDKPISVGVYGMRGEELIIPTIYTEVGKLMVGTNPNNDPSVPHSPELVQQLIDIANSVNTPEYQQNIVDQVLDALPRAEEAEVYYV